ncbi:hypothetical protein AJ87_35535 [Rhizobium yanglingense]|nr:hypothetical protein AJ87_35535 [Rhizobium yanglingense]
MAWSVAGVRVSTGTDMPEMNDMRKLSRWRLQHAADAGQLLMITCPTARKWQTANTVPRPKTRMVLAVGTGAAPIQESWRSLDNGGVFVGIVELEISVQYDPGPVLLPELDHRIWNSARKRSGWGGGTAPPPCGTPKSLTIEASPT